MLMSFSCDWSICCYLFWLRGMVCLMLYVLGSQSQLGPWRLCFLPLTFVFEVVWLQKSQVRKTSWRPSHHGICEVLLTGKEASYKKTIRVSVETQMHCLCPSPDLGFYSMVSLARAGYWLTVQNITLSRGVEHGSRGKKTPASSQLKNSFGKPPPELIIAGGFAKLSRDHNFLLPLI